MSVKGPSIMLLMQQLIPINWARVLVKGTRHEPTHVKRKPIAVAPRRPIPERARKVGKGGRGSESGEERVGRKERGVGRREDSKAWLLVSQFGSS